MVTVRRVTARRQLASPVANLGAVRARRQVDLWREKIASVIDLNRRTFDRLHASGALYSTEGARAGRDLLRAHEQLLKVTAVLDRIEKAAVKAPRPDGARLGTLYRRLDGLLDRTHALTHRSGGHVARLRRCRATSTSR